jgi:hypothetical protein
MLGIVPKMLKNADPVYWLAVENVGNPFVPGQRLHEVTPVRLNQNCH